MSKVLLLNGCLLSCCCTFVPLPECVGWKNSHWGKNKTNKQWSSSYRLIQCTYMVPLCSKNQMNAKKGEKKSFTHSIKLPTPLSQPRYSQWGDSNQKAMSQTRQNLFLFFVVIMHSPIKSKHVIKNVPQIWLCDSIVTWAELSSSMCSWGVRQSRELLRKGYYRIIIVQNMHCCIMQESTLWFFQLPVRLNFQLYRCCLSA